MALSKTRILSLIERKNNSLQVIANCYFCFIPHTYDNGKTLQYIHWMDYLRGEGFKSTVIKSLEDCVNIIYKMQDFPELKNTDLNF